MEEQKTEEPIDLKLHEAVTENIKLINGIKPIIDFIYWLKFFMVFLGLCVLLVILKYFGFF